MTNKAHPPKTPIGVVVEMASAPLSVPEIRSSNDPLAPVLALAPTPVEPEDYVSSIDEADLVYSLRMAGHTPKQIAHHLTKTTKRTWTTKEVDAAYTSVGRENVARTADQLAYAAQMELDRIEAALKALWDDVLNGNLAATDRYLKLSERKSKLLGLDSPDVAVQLRMGSSDVDFSSLTTEELKVYLSLQQKVSQRPKELPVATPRRLLGE